MAEIDTLVFLVLSWSYTVEISTGGSQGRHIVTCHMFVTSSCCLTQALNQTQALVPPSLHPPTSINLSLTHAFDLPCVFTGSGHEAFSGTLVIPPSTGFSFPVRCCSWLQVMTCLLTTSWQMVVWFCAGQPRRAPRDNADDCVLPSVLLPLPVHSNANPSVCGCAPWKVYWGARIRIHFYASYTHLILPPPALLQIQLRFVHPYCGPDLACPLPSRPVRDAPTH